MPRILAAIDIGSNTVHLLVAELLKNGTLRRIDNRSEWLSLGEDVTRTGRIPPAKADMLVQLLRNYEIVATQSRAPRPYVFATEAMRSAENGVETLERIRNETGLDVEVIDAATEAAYSLAGVSLDCDCEGQFLLLEVGGGSAQVAVCQHGELNSQWSIPIGTGRIAGAVSLGDPPTDVQVEAARELIALRMDEAGLEGTFDFVVASGGIARGFVRALHPDGEKWIAKEEIDYVQWACQRLTHQQIGLRFGVKPKRAAAMLAGALVYGELLERFGAKGMFVSEYGVREGAILLRAKASGEAWLG